MDEPVEGQLHAEMAAEQARIDAIYNQLDLTRERTRYRLQRADRDPIAGTPGSISEREAMVVGYLNRLTELNGVDERLCFGRLDTVSGERHYVGRLGLSDDAQVPLLMDWRADAAAPFYQATANNPMGIVRRRNISTENRRVTALDDDVLMIDEMSDADLATVTGSDALLTSLDSGRTGRMRDIVATIQSEQDEIIRSPAKGVLVVEGGPGTGKSVVALHRVAYLLYSERARIARSGALVVGPNRTFINYIDHVLPALGETGVILRSLDEFFPGVTPTHEDNDRCAQAKGDISFASIVANAIKLYQRPPASDEAITVNGAELVVDRSLIQAAINRGQQSHLPHNEAWVVYAKDALRRIARRLATKLSLELDDETLANLIADLREAKQVRRIINLAWLPRTPEQLIGRLLTDERFLRRAAPHLDSGTCTALLRVDATAWTTGDVPLLDEAAELLGDVAASQPAAGRPNQEKSLSYARAALADSGVAASMITAEQYANRFETPEDRSTLAERAESDREWTFAHVVVDEAQELTAMQWRMVMRRAPNRSMTLVGDPAQASSPGAVANWSNALEPYVQDRWRSKSLTVNYRTPQYIMDVAARFHATAGLTGVPPHAVRQGRWPVEVIHTDDISSSLRALAYDLLAETTEGTIAVIADHETLRVLAPLSREIDAQRGESSLVTASFVEPAEAKGLEFDAVVIVEPGAWHAEHRDGDLYVALTRATQRLVVVHERPLPFPLRTSLAPE